MKTKVMMGVMSVACCMGSLAGAEESATDGTFGVDVVSAYVFRGATINDELNVQPALGGTFYGVGLGTWASLNTDASQFDEIDFTASYALPLGDLPFGLALGYTEYTYPTAVVESEVEGGAASGLAADREVSATVSLNTVLAPSLLVAYGIEGPFLDEGLHIALGVKHTQELAAGVSATGKGTLAYEAGDNFAENGFSYGQVSLSAGKGPVSIGVDYIIETDKDVIDVDEEIVGKASFALPL